MNKILAAMIKVAENERITITKLEQKIGASKGVLSRAISNNSDIQSKWLLSLVENYPHYNTEWILTGNGDMLKCEKNIGLEKEDKSSINYKELADSRKETIELLKDKIKGLEQFINESKKAKQSASYPKDVAEDREKLGLKSK